MWNFIPSIRNILSRKVVRRHTRNIIHHFAFVWKISAYLSSWSITHVLKNQFIRRGYQRTKTSICSLRADDVTKPVVFLIFGRTPLFFSHMHRLHVFTHTHTHIISTDKIYIRHSRERREKQIRKHSFKLKPCVLFFSWRKHLMISVTCWTVWRMNAVYFILYFVFVGVRRYL